MPKMKSHRGAAKRYKVTGTGKLIRHKAFSSHICRIGLYVKESEVYSA